MNRNAWNPTFKDENGLDRSVEQGLEHGMDRGLEREEPLEDSWISLNQKKLKLNPCHSTVAACSEHPSEDIINELLTQLQEKESELVYILQENNRINLILKEYEVIIDKLKSNLQDSKQESTVLQRLLRFGWTEQERTEAIQANKTAVLQKLTKMRKIHGKLISLMQDEFKNELDGVSDLIIGLDKIRDTSTTHEES